MPSTALVGPPDPALVAKYGLGPKAVFIDGPDFFIVEQIGDGPASIPDTDNGWQEIPRPGRKPITEWFGEALRRESVPIMLDGFDENKSVQGRLDALVELGDPREGDNGKTLPPPVFTVSGDAVHFDKEHWVLESISLATESPDVIRARDGRLIRQALVLHLMEYVSADQLRIKKKKRKRTRGKTYKVHEGDTWLSIAKDKADKGASNQEIRDYAKRIARRNGARPDIRNELNVGREIRIPPFER